MTTPVRRADDTSPLILPTEFGCPLVVHVRAKAIIGSKWAADGVPYPPSLDVQKNELSIKIVRQVEAYIARRLAVFNLPLALEGTEFEQATWRAVTTIPFGARLSYADVARAIGRPGAHRAVARAMTNVAFDLLVPAHRVIGADGRLKGADADSMRGRLLAFEREARRSDKHRDVRLLRQ